MKDKKAVWVVIPAHNEERHIAKTIEESAQFADNILVVDDGSKDATLKIAEKSSAKIIKHVLNLGKGAALKTGCDYAVKKGADKIILLDGDGQHEPSEIPHFLKNLENHEIVFGHRTNKKKMPFILKLGNFAIGKLTHLLYKANLKDTQCGFRAFNTKIYKDIRWKSSDYSMESEMIAKVIKKKIIYTQVPIRTIYADNYKGTTVLDGFKIVFDLFWWRIFG